MSETELVAFDWFPSESAALDAAASLGAAGIHGVVERQDPAGGAALTRIVQGARLPAPRGDPPKAREILRLVDTGDRLVGALLLVPYVFRALIAGQWCDRGHLVVIGAALLGGMPLQHPLISARRRPGCANLLFNLAIGRAEGQGKRFRCRRCGEEVSSWEGFVWHRDTSG